MPSSIPPVARPPFLLLRRTLAVPGFLTLLLGTTTCGDSTPSGFSSLVQITAEPKGMNCKDGGQRIDTGLDKNRDGKLAADEITTSSYVCGASEPDPLIARRTAWARNLDAQSMNHHSDDLVATAPQGSGRLTLKRLSHSDYNAFDFGRSAAEIVDFNPVTKQVFTHNTRLANVSYFTLTAEGKQTNRGVVLPAADLALMPAGKFGVGVNSCAVADNTLAIVAEIFDFEQRVYVEGRILFYDVSSGGAPVFITAVKVGAEPDSGVYTHDGKRLLVAGEGEPTMLDKNAGQVDAKDPVGSISIITRPAQGWRAVSQVDVVTLGFEDFNVGGPRASELPKEIHRIAPEGETWAQQLEPEYIAPSPDDKTAFVVLQEANSFAIVDLTASPPRIKEIHHLGFKDGLLPGNEFDGSDFDGLDPGSADATIHGRVRLANWPVYLMYQPDTIKSYVARDGKTYYATANEGDPRGEDWGWTENKKVSTLQLDPAAFPGKEILQRDDMLGRLQVTSTMGDADGDGMYENLYAFGGRSFSIWDDKGNLVFDSGSDFERTTAALYGEFLNSMVKEYLPEGNSPWKGPEPEALSLGVISVPKKVNPGEPPAFEDRTFCFIGAEKISGWWVYDVTNPKQAEFVTYFSNRRPEIDPTLDTDADLSPEGSVFVSAKDSPTGKPLLIAGNEVSSTTSVYEITVNF